MLSLAGSHKHGLLLSDPRRQAHSEDCLWQVASQRTAGVNAAVL